MFSDCVESCKEFVWRNDRYSIELVVVKRMLENVRCLIKLGVVRSLLGECKRYSIELRAVRSLLGELRGIR